VKAEHNAQTGLIRRDERPNCFMVILKRVGMRIPKASRWKKAQADG